MIQSLRSLEIEKTQLGWRGELFLSIQTHQQFTDEFHTVEVKATSFWKIIAKMIKAFYSFKYKLQSKPGPYNNPK